MINDGIIIKGNKEGLNAVIRLDQYRDLDDAIDALINKLSKGKQFYKGCSLKITTDLKYLSHRDKRRLEHVLFEEFLIKECIYENSDEKDNKTFNGIYEGRTKFIRKTVRSGQCISYPGNIVIIGDINSGAEVYAGGNIIVLGAVKGNVHAGSSGNYKSIIAAFSLEPQILEIATLLTISPDDGEKPLYPEVAKVKDGAIIVEPYLVNKYI
ncbi:septum site-determining protein MinC [Clostridium frigidicarnis]|uniref:Probable septum site-determining protein MinC n=1 Tax=Clostridium frigidicarnis TaxID=84698 RepID=A0A1I1A167_9CLOT|nr:septum site-determining protein MinC [Clostridium frigidicarnis]SFB31694.1 septum site-determining protein MinC [Clostridium frigidicarnis]